MEGIAPSRTAWYADWREIPSQTAASVTVMVFLLVVRVIFALLINYRDSIIIIQEPLFIKKRTRKFDKKM